MRGIIISESKEVERLLNCESSSDWGIGIGKVVMLMGKYYYSLGLDRQEVYKNINSYLKERMDKYTSKKWSEMINNVLDTIEKNEWYNLIDIDRISITKAEWDTIVGIGNVKLEKIAFVLLCYIKVYRARGSKNDKMNEIGNLLLESVGSGTSNDKLLLADLKDLGLIEVGKLNHMYVKPLYISEESDKYFEINNFNKVTTYYDEYKNGVKYGECKVCNKRFKLKSNNSNQKYCSKCGKEINLNNAKQRQNENYFKRKKSF